MNYVDQPPNKKIGPYMWNHQAFLGQGAFGKVYLGYHQDTKSDYVAIKQIDMKNMQNKMMKDALSNELMILKLLKGQHTCGLIDHFKTANNTYIVQPYCNGGDFRSYLTKQHRIKEQDALKILKDILLGMKEMVDNDLVHRDIKPENILIKDDTFIIADFGFSTKIDGKSMTTQCGTPLYMSPQILQNQQYSSKNDIWAIGMIYYEMLFGKTPWNVKTQTDLYKMPKTIPIRFPYNCPISEMSKQFIMKCLAYEEYKRLSWNEIFGSDIYTKSGEFKSDEDKKTELSEPSQKVLKDLQNIIIDNDLDFKKIFDNFATNNQLNLKQMTRLLQIINSKIQNDQAEEIFRQIDTSNDGFVSQEEFKQIIEQNEYGDDQVENQMLADIKAKKVIKNLRNKIKAHDLDIRVIFNKLDRSGDGQLDYKELTTLLKNVDPSLTNNELRLLFSNFDVDNSGTINFQEFEQTITQGLTESVQKLSKSNMNQDFQKFFTKLKSIVINNELDLEMIFQHFDQDNNQYLDLEEFDKFVKVIYFKASEKDIKNVFEHLDANGDQKIEIEEFMKIVQ